MMKTRCIPPHRDNPRFHWHKVHPECQDGEPLAFDLHGLDTNGDPWRAWGTYRRAEFWSQKLFPASMLAHLTGKQLHEVVQLGRWLAPLNDWIVRRAVSDKNGFLVLCWPPERFEEIKKKTG